MGHFTIRTKEGSSGEEGNIGVRYFHDDQKNVINTVLLYESTLHTSEHVFVGTVINSMLGSRVGLVSTDKYEIHLDKKDSIIKRDFLVNQLGLKDTVDIYNVSYKLTNIGIAAKPKIETATGSNLVILYTDTNGLYKKEQPTNEIEINFHIVFSSHVNIEATKKTIEGACERFVKAESKLKKLLVDLSLSITSPNNLRNIYQGCSNQYIFTTQDNKLAKSFKALLRNSPNNFLGTQALMLQQYQMTLQRKQADKKTKTIVDEDGFTSVRHRNRLR